MLKHQGGGGFGSISDLKRKFHKSSMVMSHLVFWGGVGNFCHASWPLTVYLVLTWISKFEHFCCSLLKMLILIFLRSSVKYFSEPNTQFKTGRRCQNPMTWEKPWLLPSNVPPKTYQRWPCVWFGPIYKMFTCLWKSKSLLFRIVEYKIEQKSIRKEAFLWLPVSLF